MPFSNDHPTNLLGQEKRWEDVYDEIAAKEMELFNALADGSALEQVCSKAEGVFLNLHHFSRATCVLICLDTRLGFP